MITALGLEFCQLYSSALFMQPSLQRVIANSSIKSSFLSQCLGNWISSVRVLVRLFCFTKHFYDFSVWSCAVYSCQRDQEEKLWGAFLIVSQGHTFAVRLVILDQAWTKFVAVAAPRFIVGKETWSLWCWVMRKAIHTCVRVQIICRELSYAICLFVGVVLHGCARDYLY